VEFAVTTPAFSDPAQIETILKQLARGPAVVMPLVREVPIEQRLLNRWAGD